MNAAGATRIGETSKKIGRGETSKEKSKSCNFLVTMQNIFSNPRGRNARRGSKTQSGRRTNQF